MRARIIADLDDIRDRSDASAVANKISLLDALHLVAMFWKRVSEKSIENCFRKGGFSKTNTGTPASEESDVASEIFNQAPDDMPKEEFVSAIKNHRNNHKPTKLLAHGGKRGRSLGHQRAGCDDSVGGGRVVGVVSGFVGVLAGRSRWSYG
jgi:hypothetical protein